MTSDVPGERGAMVRVAVVDDQPLLVAAFVALIDAQTDLTVVGTAGDGQAALELCAHVQPDVVLMDIRMPVLDGVAATARLGASGERPYVLVLTTVDVDDLVLQAMRAGARGFVLKDTEPEALLQAIRAVHRGGTALDPEVAGHVVRAWRERGAPVSTSAAAAVRERLTPREVEVLELISAGRSNTEIAAQLVVAETMVKTHVGNLLLKLDCWDRVALVVMAHTAGLLPR